MKPSPESDFLRVLYQSLVRSDGRESDTDHRGPAQSLRRVAPANFGAGGRDLIQSGRRRRGYLGAAGRRGRLERSVEPAAEAVASWTRTCQEIANMTLFPKAESWIFGANIPGKPNTVYFYLAGLGAYRQQLADIRSEGYRGFQLQ